MASDWYDLKFLESAANVSEIVARSTGRRPDSSVAREISVCIQQGRLYFEAAQLSPVQIKPLQIYYGVVAFAKGVVIATQNKPLAELARSHGLSDVSPPNSIVEDLKLRLNRAGAFQEFNDAIAPLGRIWYFDHNTMPRWVAKPFDSFSPDLNKKQVTIRDVLSRVPGLSDEYSRTFAAPANTTHIDLGYENPVGLCTLRIDDPELFTDRASLVASVRKWREDYPFLNSWRLKEATHAWGSAILVFDNIEKGADDDLSEQNLNQSGINFTSSCAIKHGDHCFNPAPDILPPLSGGYTRESNSVTKPLFGANLPEYSIQFLGSFLLSSLVRYRPQVWQHAISRSATDQMPVDDRTLSLIEHFLDDVLAAFPRMVVRTIDYKQSR